GFATVNLSEQLLHFRIRMEAGDLVLEDQIGPHTAGGKVPHARFILGSVSVAIEVAHTGPLRVLEQLDQEKRALGVVAAKARILGRVGFDAFSSTPADVRGSTELNAEVDRRQRFL